MGKDKRGINKKRQKAKPAINAKTRELLTKKLKALESDLAAACSKEQVNSVKFQLGRPAKPLSAYQQSQSNAKHETSVEIAPETTKTWAEMIPIPKGKAPETQGQIFYALTQIPMEPQPQEETPNTANSDIQPARVYSSAPVMRDFQKEVVQMVPLSLRRNTKPVDLT